MRKIQSMADNDACGVGELSQCQSYQKLDHRPGTEGHLRRQTPNTQTSPSLPVGLQAPPDRLQIRRLWALNLEGARFGDGTTSRIHGGPPGSGPAPVFLRPKVGGCSPNPHKDVHGYCAPRSVLLARRMEVRAHRT